MSDELAIEAAREYVTHFGMATRDAAYRAFMDGYALATQHAKEVGVAQAMHLKAALTGSEPHTGPERRTGSRSLKDD